MSRWWESVHSPVAREVHLVWPRRYENGSLVREAVCGEVLRARSVGVLCGERIPWHGAHYRLTGLVGEAEMARWLELVTCEACKAALVQEALQAAG